MTGGFGSSEYDRIREGSRNSAAVIVPLLMEYKPSHILDVGCGEGWFASEFGARGTKAFGVDFAVPDTFAPNVSFFEKDLAEPGSLDSFRDYGLVVCLEVAEHLPFSRGPSFVAELCAAGMAVAFSAAVPGQGGHLHINERWQSYWAKLFAAHGLLADVSLRDRIWNNRDVEPWYRQNLVIYLPEKTHAAVGGRTGPLDVVHPEIFAWYRYRS